MAGEKNCLPLILGITGASGSVYGLHLAGAILAQQIPLFLLVTKTGRSVIQTETGRSWEDFLEDLRGRSAPGLLQTPESDDFSSPVASGSFRTGGMVIAPCSMGSLARIASGLSSNLMERAADVCLKEGRPLILLARESPLSAIHLENMLCLSRAGAVIMPPLPVFYTKPKTIEDLVKHTCDRVLDRLGHAPTDIFRW